MSSRAFLEVELYHGGGVTLIHNTSMQKTCQIYTEHLRLIVHLLTSASLSTFKFIIIISLPNKLLIVGFYSQ